MTNPKPVPSHQVLEGQDYWAAWGNKGWSAIRVVKADDKWCKVLRVDPKTNEIITKEGTKSKARASELVSRDPTLKGKDRPEAGPADIFAEIRGGQKKMDEPEPTRPAPAVAAPPPKPEPVVRPTPKPVVMAQPEPETHTESRVSHLLDLLDDKSTIDDW